MASATLKTPSTTQESSRTLNPPSARPSHARKPSLRRTQDSRENLHRRKNSKTSKSSTHSQQESTAQRGQEFRVGNIGTNGLIYLRPVKPSSQTQDPVHPTSDRVHPKSRIHNDPQWRSSTSSTATARPSLLSSSPSRDLDPSRSAAVGPDYRRLSSKQEQGPAHSGTTPQAAVEVIIDRASHSQPPSSAKSLDTLPIPHYRLGTPHFTDRGSPVLHSSINTGNSSEEPPVPSLPQHHNRDVSNQTSPKADLLAPRTSTASGQRFNSSNLKRTLHKVQSKEPASPTTQNTQNIVKLRRSITTPSREADLRISPITGQLLAASIPQLIAQITSPELLDYDLLSDFFLTYRLFMTPHELATRLVERLNNAIRSRDEYSRIVRVRTFVALRHWILNYFVDDFVANLDLRARFCVLVNDLCRGLQRDAPEQVGDLRILEELKKCWRHTCGLFWDVMVQPDTGGLGQDIVPGGVLGSRHSPYEFAEDTSGNDGSQLMLDPEELPRGTSPCSFLAGPDIAYNQTSKLGSMTISSASSLSDFHPQERQSIQAMSCSIPTTFFSNDRNHRNPSQGPRPAPASVALRKQRTKPPSTANNPRKHHKRSASFSDALRDDRTPLAMPNDDSKEPTPVPVALPGSLVRGATISPTTAYIDAVIPGTPFDEPMPKPQGQILEHDVDQRGRQFQPSNPTVRRFIGSVRRALSAKGPSQRTYSLSPHRLSPDRGPAANSSFRTPSRREPSAQKRKLVGGRAVLRIDILAAEVSEAFKAAVQEVRDAQETLRDPSNPETISAQQEPLPQMHTGHALQVPRGEGKGESVTTGSRSIVIMDDTGQTTPKPDFQAPNEPFDEVPSQESSMHRDLERVHTVPIFLDQGQATHADIQSDQNDESESSYVRLDSENQVDQDLVGSNTEQNSNEVEFLETPKAGHHRVKNSLGQSPASSSHHVSLEAATATTEETETSTNDPSHLERPPARQLRRLPGGDLKTANHVHSLDDHSQAQLGRAMGNALQGPQIPPRGSSTNAKELQSSANGVGQANEASRSPGKDSHQAVRPSFEREVAKLAQIPDVENGNSVESALRKLEGRGQSEMVEPPLDLLAEVSGPARDSAAPDGRSNDEPTELYRVKRQHREDDIVEVNLSTPPALNAPPSSHSHVVVDCKPLSVAESSTTQSSIPLLERGSSYVSKQPTTPAIVVGPTAEASSQGKVDRDQESQQTATTTLPGSEDSYEIVEQEEGLREARAGKKPARSSQAHRSFLLNDNESLSELSSVTSDNVSDSGGLDSPGMHSFFEDEAGSGWGTPRRGRDEGRLRHSRLPIHLERPGNPLADEFQVDPAYVPGSRPVTRDGEGLDERGQARSAEDLFDKYARHVALTDSPSASHLPFILAYDSLTLAQQFTVIERDALCEIDWRDLIDLRWNQTATAYYNWVDYLRSNSGSHPHNPQAMLRPGVDLCIARFNLVVRWVKSEVLLTQDVIERAATIVKFIHIAQHARRLRNWATMYQIAMALVSADLSRLKQTWASVPEEEQETLMQLEELIMPKRNFHNLRIEIETATSTWAQGGEGGCIPFIGVYTHDLIYNAQKPTKVRATPRKPLENGVHGDLEEEPGTLINFERHHTAATIVKNLLRLIEASSQYTFQPDKEVTSRCLWLGALHDAEVTRRSKELEPFERSSA